MTAYDGHADAAVMPGGYAGSAVGESGLAKGPRLKPPKSLPLFHGPQGPCSLRSGYSIAGDALARISHTRFGFQTIDKLPVVFHDGPGQRLSDLEEYMAASAISIRASRVVPSWG